MNWQQQTWYRAGGDILARAGFSLAMCGALAGVLYLTANNGADEMATASTGPSARAATVIASYEGSPGVSQSQMAIDASPAAVSLQAKIPAPVERVAAASLTPVYSVLPTKRPDREPVVVASNVAHFETCLPDCETHDPLIVGHVEKTYDPGLSPSATDELVQRVSYTEQRPSFLGRALDVPGDAFRHGRRALTTLVRAAL